MRSDAGRTARAALLTAALLLPLPTALRAQHPGGSLSGVVLPDLPPEVSPGEEISFSAPQGSAGGTWTLSGVVAEEEPPAGPPMLPTPVKVRLNLPEGGEPWTPEHLVALAVAAAGREGTWSQCFGSPAPAPPAAAARKEIDGVDVIIKKKPKGVADPAAASGVAVGALPADYSSEPVRQALGTGFAVRYFGVDAALPGCPTCKSFFESRSNRAEPASVAVYAIATPGGTVDVEAAGLTDLGGDSSKPSTIVAASITQSGTGGRGSQRTADVVLAAAQCAPSAMRSFWPPKDRPRGKPNLRFRVPETLKPGQPLSASYKDPAGATQLDVREVPGVRVVPPRPANPKPSLTAAPELAIAGQTVCACGNFPDARSRQGFLFDERAVGALSASSRMAILPVDATTPPGRHVISGSPEAGFTAQDVVHTQVIAVGGKLDASQLRRGQSTQMELTITGTDKPVSFKVVNKTPRIISIGGRLEQVLTSTGGSPNRLVQAIDSVGPGNFNIDYSLAGDRCPCQGERP